MKPWRYYTIAYSWRDERDYPGATRMAALHMAGRTPDEALARLRSAAANGRLLNTDGDPDLPVRVSASTIGLMLVVAVALTVGLCAMVLPLVHR